MEPLAEQLRLRSVGEKDDEVASLPKCGWVVEFAVGFGVWCVMRVTGVKENTAKTCTAEDGGGDEEGGLENKVSGVLHGHSREEIAQAAVQPAVLPSAYKATQTHESYEKQESYNIHRD